ncbi:MAG TPA: TetR/AcrR family transcriptional regulator [Rhizomicrobium sp.]|jgi:TetR/AcrR family transcriptional repressor of nem operon|nr:TetR/AcrR family transcriptional regulator [Rhizomicrobium sp.]
MPYPEHHARQTRTRIVESARKLFNRHGFDGVSIGAIMEEAGLTHGGFYRHFGSKGDLYAEALDCFFTNPHWACGWDGMEPFDGDAELGPQVVRAYLSDAHFEDVPHSCPMVALPSDVARSSPNAKRAYRAAFEGMLAVLGAKHGRDRALAIAALCVGGMVIARASDDRALGDELRQAATKVALELGGWPQKAPKPRRTKGKRYNSTGPHQPGR